MREKVREKVRVGPFPARGGTHHVLAGALTPLTSLRDGRSRSEQKKLLEVLTIVIKGEEPCVSLDKAENILVIFLYSCTPI